MMETNGKIVRIGGGIALVGDSSSCHPALIAGADHPVKDNLAELGMTSLASSYAANPVGFSHDFLRHIAGRAGRRPKGEGESFHFPAASETFNV